jgi:hypothetical protein
VLSLPLLQFDWYRAQVQARNPALKLPPAASSGEIFLTQFVAANLDARPIFLTTDAHSAGDGFALQPAGPLFKVQKK